NNSITLLWQVPEPSAIIGGTVALGPHGEIYDVNSSQIAEIDPADGSTMRTIHGSFLDGSTPAVTSGALWVDSSTETLAYDLASLQMLASFPGTSQSSGDGPGAFTSEVFILGRFNGIDVYRTNR